MTDSIKNRIKDNPTCAELLKTAKGMESLSRVVSFFEGLGIRNKKLSEAFKQVPDLVQKTGELVNLPDRFNDHFSKLGWIAYETLNVDLMREAVRLADNGRLQESEALLVEHYNEDNLDWALKFMLAIEEYRLRDQLAQKAKEDYLAGRYHASVPVVLAIIDGIVSDIEQKGFFADGVDLTAWDSVAAHSSGLQQLCSLFNQTRKKTTTEQIQIPYRHGILHGRDLGYANKIVAAKTWATLFAIRDWALSIKQDKKHPRPKEREPSLLKILKSYAKTLEQKKKLKIWQPRSVHPGEDCPATGCPNDYDDDSPERTFALFMEYWSKNNYGKMAESIKTFIDEPLSKLAGRLRQGFQGKSVKNFRLVSINDEAPAITEITAVVDILHEDKSLEKEVQVRMIYEDEDGNPLLRGEPSGKWRMMEHSFHPIVVIM